MAIVCNCPGRCEIHPKPKVEVIRPEPGQIQRHEIVPPDIDAMDKLTLKTLEAEFLKAQLEVQRMQQQVMARMQQAHAQLEQFSAAMFDKHGVKQSDWLLDLVKLGFIPRTPQAQAQG